jgi:hypothetical protein
MNSGGSGIWRRVVDGSGRSANFLYMVPSWKLEAHELPFRARNHRTYLSCRSGVGFENGMCLESPTILEPLDKQSRAYALRG